MQVVVARPLAVFIDSFDPLLSKSKYVVEVKHAFVSAGPPVGNLHAVRDDHRLPGVDGAVPLHRGRIDNGAGSRGGDACRRVPLGSPRD